MLTVRVCQLGFETVCQFDRVQMNYEGSSRTPFLRGFLGDSSADFDNGVAYVMNDHGSTVAKYELRHDNHILGEASCEDVEELTAEVMIGRKSCRPNSPNNNVKLVKEELLK